METAKAAILAIVDPRRPSSARSTPAGWSTSPSSVRSSTSFPGRDGLVHISKLGRGKRINAVEDVLSLGDEIEVRVEEIDDRGKVSLVPAGDLADSDGGSDGGALPERAAWRASAQPASPLASSRRRLLGRTATTSSP